MERAWKLRARLNSARRTGAGQGRAGFPAELREACVRHARARLEQEASRSEVAEELGVALQTLRRWLGEYRDTTSLATFQEVTVLNAVATGLVVTGPRGLRVDGLTLEELTELWRRLEE